MQRPKTQRLYFPDSRSEPRSSVSIVTTQHCLFAGFREGRNYYQFQDSVRSIQIEKNGNWKRLWDIRRLSGMQRKKGFASDENSVNGDKAGTHETQTWLTLIHYFRLLIGERYIFKIVWPIVSDLILWSLPTKCQALHITNGRNATKFKIWFDSSLASWSTRRSLLTSLQDLIQDFSHCRDMAGTCDHGQEQRILVAAWWRGKNPDFWTRQSQLS